MNLEKLSPQARADLGECVDAYYHGGKRLASLTFRAVCEARKLTKVEAVMLGGAIRQQLTALGYLAIH